jgi:YegS/Rv2252/BmrU family lipid kinase
VSGFFKSCLPSNATPKTEGDSLQPAKAILIFNPKTGRYGSNRNPPIDAVCSRLAALGVSIELRKTSGPGDATTIAHVAAKNGRQNIIVCGGDGTINEALQGIIGTNARLAILPRGTGNVLARDLGIPIDNFDAAAVIAKGKPQTIFPGCAIDETSGARRYFLLMAGIGLDADVVRRVRPQLKKRFGKAAFWFSGLAHLARWRPALFEVEINDQRLVGTFAAIGKAASYGGDLSVTPRARIEIPDFEVCVVSSRSRLRYLKLLPHVMRKGVPENRDEVTFVRTTRVVAKGNAPVQVDGELIGQLPMSFEIALEPIEIIVP